MSDKKILLIDDDPAILDSISAVLKQNGYSVTTALSGAEGLQVFDSLKPDLVLCDMMMETVDQGSKVAAGIRKKNTDVPVYLLSSIGSATAMNTDIDSLGFNGVFQKPVNPDSLLTAVKKAIG